MAATMTAEGMAAGAGGYPVQVTFDPEQRINRLWGIPGVGWTVRILLLIPHFIVLWVLAFLLGLSVLISWIPVLFTGRQAAVLIEFYSAYYRYTTRVLAWALFLVGPYPPILPSSAPYPVNVEVQGGGTINRLWGIPFLGIWARGVLIIPHAILLVLLYIPLILFSLVAWIPILINGRMPTIGYAIYGGFLRLTTRATLWVLLVPAPYPPISIT
jgi:hypothetical protein